METRANHVLIGTFTLILGVAVVLFALWAGKYQSQAAWREYEVIFREAVTGLSVGGVVQYNGIKIGEVRDLRLAPQDPRQVIARIRVKSDAPIKTDTQAKLALTGLTGISLIQLTGGSPAAPLLQPREGQEVAVIVADESALQKLLSSTEDIAATASNVLLRIDRVLSDENMDRVGRIVADLETVSDAVASEEHSIRTLIADAAQAANTLRSATAAAERTFSRLDATVTRIDQDLVHELPKLVARLDHSLAALEQLSFNANAVLAENREAIASFGNQGLAQVGPAVTELRALLRELTRVSEQLRDDPSGFLLGRGQPREFSPK